MRRELRGLRRMKDNKVNTELQAINDEIQKVNIQDNLLNFLKSDFKNQMQDNMHQIEETEAVLDNERLALKEHIGQIESEEKELNDQLAALDRKLAQQDKELRSVQRDWERKIDA